MTHPGNHAPSQAKRRGSDLWLPAVLLILVQMASGLRDMPLFSFFAIYLQDQLSLQPVVISSVIAGAQIAGMVTALLGGAITARVGSKWVLVLGLTLSGLSSFAYQVHTFWAVTLLWFLSGAGNALVTIGGASYLTRISAQKALGILAAFYALSMTLGGAIGNPLAGMLIEQRGFAVFSQAAMLVSVVVILLVMLLMPQHRERSAPPGSLCNLGTELRATARQANLGVLIGMRCLPTIYYGMLTVLIPLLINNLSGSKVTVAVYGTTNLVMASIAQLLAGRAADRWGARLPTTIAYTALVVSGIGLGLSAGTLWGLFSFGVLGIAAAWSLSTMMYIWVNDSIPKTEHPATFGLLHAIWSLSMITGSLAGGWLVALLPGLPFLLGGLLNGGAILLARVFYQRLAKNDSSLPAAEG